MLELEESRVHFKKDRFKTNERERLRPSLFYVGPAPNLFGKNTRQNQADHNRGNQNVVKIVLKINI
jgi:hypothetical protein